MTRRRRLRLVFVISTSTNERRGCFRLFCETPRSELTEITSIQNLASVIACILVDHSSTNKGWSSGIKKIDRIVYVKTSDAVYCSNHEVQREPRCFHPALPFNPKTCLYLPLPFPMTFLSFSFFLNFVAFYLLLVLVLPQARNIAWSISLRVNVQI